MGFAPWHRVGLGRARPHVSVATIRYRYAGERRSAGGRSYVNAIARMDSASTVRRSGKRGADWVSKTDIIRYHRCPYAFWLIDTGQVSFAEQFSPFTAAIVEAGVAFEDDVVGSVPDAPNKPLEELFKEDHRLLRTPRFENNELRIFGIPDGIDTAQGLLAPSQVCGLSPKHRSPWWHGGVAAVPRVSQSRRKTTSGTQEDVARVQSRRLAGITGGHRILSGTADRRRKRTRQTSELGRQPAFHLTRWSPPRTRRTCAKAVASRTARPRPRSTCSNIRASMSRTVSREKSTRTAMLS